MMEKEAWRGRAPEREKKISALPPGFATGIRVTNVPFAHGKV